MPKLKSRDLPSLKGKIHNEVCLFVCLFVCFSALEYCLNVENMNLSAIRTIRVLRPLRAINRIPSEFLPMFTPFIIIVLSIGDFLRIRKRTPCISSNGAASQSPVATMRHPKLLIQILLICPHVGGNLSL